MLYNSMQRGLMHLIDQIREEPRKPRKEEEEEGQDEKAQG